MRTTLVLVLALGVLALAATPAAVAEPLPIPPPWSCIPESPCCDTLVCQPEPCRIGHQYWC